MIGAEGVGADKLSAVTCFMCRGHRGRAHLMQPHADAAPGKLPGGLAPGKPAADNVDIVMGWCCCHGKAGNCVIARLQALPEIAGQQEWREWRNAR